MYLVMCPLHLGQDFSLMLHCLQQMLWPHGRKVMSTSISSFIQTTQYFSSPLAIFSAWSFLSRTRRCCSWSTCAFSIRSLSRSNFSEFVRSSPSLLPKKLLTLVVKLVSSWFCALQYFSDVFKSFFSASHSWYFVCVISWSAFASCSFHLTFSSSNLAFISCSALWAVSSFSPKS